MGHEMSLEVWFLENIRGFPKKSKLQVKKELPSLFGLLKAQLHPKKYAPYDTLALPNELLNVCVFLHSEVYNNLCVL